MKILFEIKTLILISVLLSACSSGQQKSNRSTGSINLASTSTSSTGSSWIVGDPIVLNNLRRVYSGTDYFTVSSPAARSTLPSNGSFAYIPTYQGANTIAMYGLYSAPYADRMDSLLTDEGGYILQGTQGFPWTNPNAVPGLIQISRYYNSSDGDHESRNVSEATPAGYVSENTPLYGYKRYNQQFNTPLTCFGGSISTAVCINQAFGGAIWQWWADGVQYIENVGAGALMQDALWEWQSTAGGTQMINPTEGGDWYSVLGLLPEDMHGSPMLSYSAANGQLHSRAIPLEFCPGGEGGANPNMGGGSNNPVIYSTMQMGKDLSFGFDGSPDVTKYANYVSYQAPINYGAIQIPATYLRALYTQLSSYDAITQILTDRTLPNCTCSSTPPRCDQAPATWNWTNFTSCGGLLATDPDTGNTFGLYGCGPNLGGSVNHWSFFNQVCTNEPNYTDETAWSSVMIDPWYDSNDGNVSVPLFSGTSKILNTYVVTGVSIDDVETKMRNLYISGYR